MREIKFRVWDKELKYMHTCGENSHDSCFYGLNNEFHYYNLQNGDGSGENGGYILMQYVGLKDKNGKEIYEGDIVKKETFDDTKPNHIAVSYAKVIYFEHLAGFYLVNRDNKILWEVGQDKYNIEVVSTIYENPELLEEK